jgi:hypothetical protein
LGGFIFAIAWTIGAFVLTFSDYLFARNSLITGRFEVVEGEVRDFKSTSKQESFVVAGHRFEYSDGVLVSGFNNMRSNGGPVDAGQHVRVTYRGNAILRLEIAR